MKGPDCSKLLLKPLFLLMERLAWRCIHTYSIFVDWLHSTLSNDKNKKKQNIRLFLSMPVDWLMIISGLLSVFIKGRQDIRGVSYEIECECRRMKWHDSMYWCDFFNFQLLLAVRQNFPHWKNSIQNWELNKIFLVKKMASEIWC